MAMKIVMKAHLNKIVSLICTETNKMINYSSNVANAPRQKKKTSKERLVEFTAF